MEYTHVGHLGLVVSRLCLGTMNFGPHTSEADSHTIMDTAVAYGINFFDTANVYGRHLGRRRDRGDHRTLVRPGRGPPRHGRPRHEGVRQDGDLAERVAPVEALDRPPVRGVAAASAHRPHRPVPDAPHRPRRVVGRDLGGDGPPQAAGQDPLRRVVELRRLAHRARQRDRVVAPTRSGSRPSSPSTT